MGDVKSIHRAIWEWMHECPSAGQLFFNFGDIKSGSTLMQPTDTLIEEYIEGQQLRRYAVELIRFRPITFDANDTGNIDMLEQIDDIIAWLQEQEAEENYPELPEGMRVAAVRVLETEAGYAIANDGIIAKYMLPFTIEYFRDAADE